MVMVLGVDVPEGTRTAVLVDQVGTRPGRGAPPAREAARELERLLTRVVCTLPRPTSTTGELPASARRRSNV